MKVTFSLPLFLLAIGVAHAQSLDQAVNEIPSCLKSCVESIVSQQCSSGTDWECACSAGGLDPTQVQASQACITAATSCSNITGDLKKLEQATIDICTAVSNGDTGSGGGGSTGGSTGGSSDGGNAGASFSPNLALLGSFAAAAWWMA